MPIYSPNAMNLQATTKRTSASRIVCSLALAVGCSPGQAALSEAQDSSYQAIPAPDSYEGDFSLLDDSQGKHEFGQVRQGTVCEKTFSLRSTGAEALTLVRLTQSCGCTDARVAIVDGEQRIPVAVGDSIPVGQRFEVITRIDTHGKNGTIGANVSLHTNRAGGLFLFELGASIREELALDPGARISFGRLGPRDRVEDSVRISSLDGEPFTLSLAPMEQLPGLATVSLLPIDPDASGRSVHWEARVALGPEQPLGAWSGFVPLVADLHREGDSSLHTVSLSLAAQGVPVVSADPPFLGFGAFPRGEIQERVVEITSSDGYRIPADATIEVRGYGNQPHAHAGAFEIESELLGQGRRLRITLRIGELPEDMRGVLAGSLCIAVGHPELPELLVRFSGFSDPARTAGQRVSSTPAPFKLDDASDES